MPEATRGEVKARSAGAAEGLPRTRIPLVEVNEFQFTNRETKNRFFYITPVFIRVSDIFQRKNQNESFFKGDVIHLYLGGEFSSPPKVGR